MDIGIAKQKWEMHSKNDESSQSSRQEKKYALTFSIGGQGAHLELILVFEAVGALGDALGGVEGLIRRARALAVAVDEVFVARRLARVREGGHLGVVA